MQIMCNGRSLGESICSFLERKDFVFFLLSLDTKLGFISQRESPTVSFTTHASLVPLKMGKKYLFVLFSIPRKGLRGKQIQILKIS
jgi:hypothetical protein